MSALRLDHIKVHLCLICLKDNEDPENSAMMNSQTGTSLAIRNRQATMDHSKLCVPPKVIEEYLQLYAFPPDKPIPTSLPPTKHVTSPLDKIKKTSDNEIRALAHRNASAAAPLPPIISNPNSSGIGNTNVNVNAIGNGNGDVGGDDNGKNYFHNNEYPRGQRNTMVEPITDIKKHSKAKTVVGMGQGNKEIKNEIDRPRQPPMIHEDRRYERHISNITEKPLRNDSGSGSGSSDDNDNNNNNNNNNHNHNHDRDHENENANANTNTNTHMHSHGHGHGHNHNNDNDNGEDSDSGSHSDSDSAPMDEANAREPDNEEHFQNKYQGQERHKPQQRQYQSKGQRDKENMSKA
ncbi:hypothetical protein RFI_18433, partial [Reticulomyxa filosa]